MQNKNEQLMIIQALGTCIARKIQKSNRRERILKIAEEKGETCLHQLRRNLHKGLEEIKEFQKLKEKLEKKYDKNFELSIKKIQTSFTAELLINCECGMLFESFAVKKKNPPKKHTAKCPNCNTKHIWNAN